MASEKMNTALRDMDLFQEQLEQVKARKTSADAHQAEIERNIAETLERAKSLRQTIEKNISASLNKKVQIA
jgi:hypothetical protein